MQKKPSIHKSQPTAPLPSRHGSRWSMACKAREAAGSSPSPTRHSAQDDAVTVAEAEAVPDPFPADHSMAARSSAHCSLRRPHARRPPPHRPPAAGRVSPPVIYPPRHTAPARFNI